MKRRPQVLPNSQNVFLPLVMEDNHKKKDHFKSQNYIEDGIERSRTLDLNSTEMTLNSANVINIGKSKGKAKESYLNFEADEINEILQSHGGDYTSFDFFQIGAQHDILSETKGNGKPIWSKLCEYAVGIKSPSSKIKNFIILQNCKKEIKESVQQLDGMIKLILNDFTTFKSYVYQRFVKPIEDANFSDEHSKEKKKAFLSLTKHKYYYEELAQNFQNSLINSKGSKRRKCKFAEL